MASVKTCAVFFALLLFTTTAGAKSIVIAAGDWPGYTHANGSGLYFDILREALEQPDLKLHIRVSNWKRAKHMFMAGRVSTFQQHFTQIVVDSAAVDPW